ncbi:hypothetical protein PG988_003300 [Apiospora saccharicola]
MPHPLALFSLVPRGERAKAVIANPLNQHLVSTLNHQQVLDVGHVRSKDSNSNTLVTLGRDADIFLEGRSISKIHCSFEIDANKVVLFYDRSTPRRANRSCKVVVRQDLNTIIGVGGQSRNYYQCELHWHTSDEDELKEQIKSREVATLEENPRFARTIDAADTVMPSRRETRIHTPGLQQPAIRYHTMETLGTGQFGEVKKAINVDTGAFMAVKLIRRPPTVANDEQHKKWDKTQPKIFMGFKDGLIHRDVKPENILCVLKNGHYQFQLGDLGLSNEARMAVTRAGTPIYMAPELSRGARPTTKLDVWSLFFTLLWTLGSDGFIDKADIFTGEVEVQREVLRLAAKPELVNIADMGKQNPEERASAAQMLVKCFEGQGLVTPKNQVPPLGGAPAVPLAGTGNAVAAPATANLAATDDIKITPISPSRAQRATTPRTTGDREPSNPRFRPRIPVPAPVAWASRRDCLKRPPQTIVLASKHTAALQLHQTTQATPWTWNYTLLHITACLTGLFLGIFEADNFWYDWFLLSYQLRRCAECHDGI